MKTYAILQHPGHNRVYYQQSGKLAMAELSLILNKLGVTQEVQERELGGVRYLTFEWADSLSEQELKMISSLSFLFALYEYQRKDDSDILIPVQAASFAYLDPKISSLLKYRGKTNELFTRMMLNAALLASDFSYDDPICLLDPVAGKGTTLYEAMIYGFHAFGIEREEKFVAESFQFVKKYMETERFKHQADKRPVWGKTKQDYIFMQEVSYATTKEAFKSEDQRKRWGMVHGKAQDTDRYFKGKPFHLIVGDLPYGVAHANSIHKRVSSGSRNPSELVNSSLPAWMSTLKKGGCIALAWNAHVLSRADLGKIFTARGMEVLNGPPFDQFEHMVDKAIKRDMIIAKMP
ncbi:MAG: hypothetical protein AAFY71_16330 [Bacteroidota bacterium]